MRARSTAERKASSVMVGGSDRTRDAQPSARRAAGKRDAVDGRGGGSDARPLGRERGMRTLRIGAGAAWWGDRIEPARRNAEEGDLDYLCFETMAEATVSAAQVRKRRDPDFAGYDTYLDDRLRA